MCGLKRVAICSSLAFRCGVRVFVLHLKSVIVFDLIEAQSESSSYVVWP